MTANPAELSNSASCSLNRSPAFPKISPAHLRHLSPLFRQRDVTCSSSNVLIITALDYRILSIRAAKSHPRCGLSTAYDRANVSGAIEGGVACMVWAIMALGMQKREVRGDLEA